MENIIKIGYFRKVDSSGLVSYISLKEFYSLWDDESKAWLKKNNEMGQCRLFCACCQDDILELSVTANYIYITDPGLPERMKKLYEENQLNIITEVEK